MPPLMACLSKGREGRKVTKLRLEKCAVKINITELFHSIFSFRFKSTFIGKCLWGEVQLQHRLGVRLSSRNRCHSLRVSSYTSDRRLISLPQPLPSPTPGLLARPLQLHFPKIILRLFAGITNHELSSENDSLFNLMSVNLTHIGWKQLVFKETDGLRGWKSETLSYLLTWSWWR